MWLEWYKVGRGDIGATQCGYWAMRGGRKISRNAHPSRGGRDGRR
eukprot:CAMPEP_0206314070 /NCGR_PEP_ID=MMETSP0106_2-20121207/14829_1 /ASSEMBLY_ACC=CAM_ASM_000206 /TAXON_ID=81532 /ORGANISM="Acanthoeca-like sp., Strain 10tr" /LENGTH=44 /DNA_ID= /DNA_START= /DNA_END= /DNA_ORIENTATION=